MRYAKMVGPSGLEPLTPVLSGLCSNQLSYGPEFLKKIGSPLLVLVQMRETWLPELKSN